MKNHRKFKKYLSQSQNNLEIIPRYANASIIITVSLIISYCRINNKNGYVDTAHV